MAITFNMANGIGLWRDGINLPIPFEPPKNEFNMVLKSILKGLIKTRGISVAHLSRSAKVPLQTLHGWLNGSEPKSLRQVKAVADYFEVDLDYLCFGIKPKASNKSELDEHRDEINAGIFEVVLRRVKK